MRVWFICSLLAGLVFGANASARASEGSAAVAGVVKGVDVPAVVYLQSVSEDPTRYYEGYRVSAQKDGRFSFEYVKPGTYRLRAEASGYMVSPDTDAEMKITLHARERRKGLTITMVPRRAICGRVTENGTAKKTWVDVFRYDPEFGTLSETSLPSTEADGSYRFADLAPGTYYVRGYMTWYPGSISFSDAKPVTVGPDKERTTCSLDVPLQYTGRHVTKVKGRIAALPVDDGRQFRVNVVERNVNGGSMPTTMAFNSTNLYKAGDTFSITVCPGNYDFVLTDKQGISAPGQSPSHKVIFASQPVDVGDTDVDGIVLTPRPMASIYGDVRFEDISPRASCPNLGGQRVNIMRLGDGQVQSAALDNKEHFEFKDVAPGDYEIYLGPFLREAVYVKSIMVDGKAVEGRRFSIKQARPVTIDITLSGDLANASGHISPDLRRQPRWEVAWTRPKGSVSGRVQGDVNGGYTVKLVSARYNSNASAVYTTHTAADGTFHFNAVDPGVCTLRAESEDSLTEEYAAQSAGQRGTPIVIGRGADLHGLTFVPPNLSTMCGRVTNSDGAPQPAARIFIWSFDGGYLRGRDKTGEAVTDANGYFRVKRLLPGEYFPALPWRDHAVFFSKDGSLSAATPIRLQPGESAGCGAEGPLELQVPSGIDKTHVVSGELVGEIPKSTGDRFWVSLVWDIHNSGEKAFVASAKLDSDRRFRIEHVPGGRFLLQLHSAYGPEPRWWSGPYPPVSHLLATQAISVSDGDVSDVRIAPIKLPSVTGTVHFQQVPVEWKKFDVSSQYIMLVPRVHERPSGAKLASDGRFTIEAEDPGEYEVQIQQLSAPLYIRSVRLNGREVKGRYLRLQPNQTASLEVFVSGNSARFNASVEPDPSLPKPEPSVAENCGVSAWPDYQLVLIPDPLPSEEGEGKAPVQPRVFFGQRAGNADNPTLMIWTLPPGHYRALVAEHLWSPFGPPTNLSQAAQQRLWSALEALGQPVTVEPGSKLDMVLQDKTVDVARVAASLGVALDSSLLVGP
jgi:hypothetical protein